jgi:hypothetical protein
MENLIIKLLDKIERLEKDLKYEKNANYARFAQGIITYKGIELEELYDFYKSKKQ